MSEKAQRRQEQDIPGIEAKMQPEPVSESEDYKASDKLKNKVAIITGGDSGIGKATAIIFAKEGANIVIVYNETDTDAKKTKARIEELDRKCLTIKGDVGNKDFCKKVIDKTLKYYGHLEIVVNNAAEQHPKENLGKISENQLRRTFETNIFSMFFLTQAALPHLKRGAAIINTASVVAYQGREQLMDYASTKGAIVSFTRSLSLNLAKKGIRVNAVAPGPIWTPLIVSTFPAEKVEKFGTNTPLGRAGQPSEVAPAFLFLASRDASYITGQVIHVNGGSPVAS